jgi:hypothetical protein
MSHIFLSQPTGKINMQISASGKGEIHAFLYWERNNEEMMLQMI